MQHIMVAYLSVYAAYNGGLFECICSILWWLIRVYMQYTMVAYLSVYAAYNGGLFECICSIQWQLI